MVKFTWFCERTQPKRLFDAVDQAKASSQVLTWWWMFEQINCDRTYKANSTKNVAESIHKIAHRTIVWSVCWLFRVCPVDNAIKTVEKIAKLEYDDAYLTPEERVVDEKAHTHHTDYSVTKRNWIGRDEWKYVAKGNQVLDEFSERRTDVVRCFGHHDFFDRQRRENTGMLLLLFLS